MPQVPRHVQAGNAKSVGLCASKCVCLSRKHQTCTPYVSKCIHICMYVTLPCYTPTCIFKGVCQDPSSHIRATTHCTLQAGTVDKSIAMWQPPAGHTSKEPAHSHGGSSSSEQHVEQVGDAAAASARANQNASNQRPPASVCRLLYCVCLHTHARAIVRACACVCAREHLCRHVQLGCLHAHTN